MNAPAPHIESFVSSASALDQLAAIRALTNDKTLARATKDPRFHEGLTLLGRRVASGDAGEAWAALTALGLIGSVAKKASSDIERVVRAHLDREPGPMPTLSADDRYYAVLAAAFASGDWTTRWAARVAVNEESAENTRRAAIEFAAKSAPDMGAVLDTLGSAFASLSADTDDPAVSIARRLKRVFDALQVEWARSGKDPGAQPGRSLASLLDQSFRRYGLPKIEQLKRDLARQVAALVHESIRARFSHSVSTSTYEPIGLVAAWFKGSSWEDVIEGSAEFASVEQDVAEALSILVRSGLTDNRMLKTLVLVAGAERATAIRNRLADSLVGSPPDALAWLGGTVASATMSASLEESRLRAFDDLLAGLLLRTGPLRARSAHARSTVAPALAATNVEAETALLDFLDESSDLLRDLTELFEARQLRLFGYVGETVEFRSALHEASEDDRAGFRHARVLEPGVEAGSEGASRRVVRKALVEPIE